MTTINIYEDKNGESLILQDNIVEELNDIKGLLNDLHKENLQLKKLILELDLKLSGKEKKEDKVNEVKKVSTKKSSKGKRVKNRPLLKNKDKFRVLPDCARVLYNNIKLLPTGKLEHGSKKARRKYTLKYDIYDIFYVMGVSSDENFTMHDFKELYENNEKWDRIDLFKLIYNIRNNKKLIRIIEDARKVLLNDLKFTKKNDILYINNVNTEIPVHQARDWCNVYINSNKSRDVYVWELQKKFNRINKDYIAIIIYNHSNNELLDVLKKEKSNTFIENNPSKRKNLIMNGELI